MIFNKSLQSQKCICYSVKQNTHILNQTVIIIAYKRVKIKYIKMSNV